jgi:UDP-N-acetyl-D-galactosamine dehydrogenase
MTEKICVVGLGYVGLPLAVGFAAGGYEVTGFDISPARISELESGYDRTEEIEPEILRKSKVRFSRDVNDLKGCTMFIVTVPTPIDEHKQPDLRPVVSATKMVAGSLSPGACVVYESTVYPGVTEEICRPLLAEISGLRPGVDFTLGYSPERINPGDKEHTLQRIVKVVSGEDEETLERVAAVYGSIITAGVHRASSIKVAEAAKVIENTQRDLNVALMNELAIIFDRVGISTRDVLEAAGTKWNFLRFTPGLVGGHCIGVDPYYLTAKAEQLGYHPEVILAGRRINDNMGRYVAQRLIKSLLAKRLDLRNARVAVLGITFKENVPDIRNTRVVDVIDELKEYGIDPIVCDPVADTAEVEHEYKIKLSSLEDLPEVQALILAVPHRALIEAIPTLVEKKLVSDGVLYDLKSALDRSALDSGLTYLAL